MMTALGFAYLRRLWQLHRSWAAFYMHPGWWRIKPAFLCSNMRWLGASQVSTARNEVQDFDK